jgi:hypothetical protein
MLYICEIEALLLVLATYNSRQGAVRNLPRWLPQLQLEFYRQNFMSNKVLRTNQKRVLLLREDLFFTRHCNVHLFTIWYILENMRSTNFSLLCEWTKNSYNINSSPTFLLFVLLAWIA